MILDLVRLPPSSMLDLRIPAVQRGRLNRRFVAILMFQEESRTQMHAVDSVAG